jgi:hypothetical protein
MLQRVCRRVQSEGDYSSDRLNQRYLLLCDIGHKYKQDMIVLGRQATPESAIKYPEKVLPRERHFADLMRQTVASVAT